MSCPITSPSEFQRIMETQDGVQKSLSVKAMRTVFMARQSARPELSMGVPKMEVTVDSSFSIASRSSLGTASTLTTPLCALSQSSNTCSSTGYGLAFSVFILVIFWQVPWTRPWDSSS